MVSLQVPRELQGISPGAGQTPRDPLKESVLRGDNREGDSRGRSGGTSLDLLRPGAVWDHGATPGGSGMGADSSGGRAGSVPDPGSMTGAFPAPGAQAPASPSGGSLFRSLLPESVLPAALDPEADPGARGTPEVTGGTPPEGSGEMSQAGVSFMGKMRGASFPDLSSPDSAGSGGGAPGVQMGSVAAAAALPETVPAPLAGVIGTAGPDEVLRDLIRDLAPARITRQIRRRGLSREAEAAEQCLQDLASQIRRFSLEGILTTERGQELELGDYCRYMAGAWPALDPLEIMSYMGSGRIPHGRCFAAVLGRVILKSSDRGEGTEPAADAGTGSGAVSPDTASKI